jgi:PKD domain
MRRRALCWLPAAVVIATTAPAHAAPSARFLGFGFQSFRSPAPGKHPPPGSVRSGGALRGCSNIAHAYLAFRGMRRGLTVTYRTTFPSYLIGDRAQPIHTLVQRVPWRFTNEVTGRAFYPAAIHLGKSFYRVPGPLDGTVRVTVRVGGRTLARGRVTVVSTCLPQAAFPPPTVLADDAGLHAHFDDVSLTRDVVSRHWDFGDPGSGAANTSTDAHPVHMYAGPGTYAVTLTITDSSGRTDTVKNRFTLG